MPARHLRSVLLPEPLRPMIPKNSPSATSNDTSFSACSSVTPRERRGWSTRCLNVKGRSWGSRNVFQTALAATVGSRTDLTVPTAEGGKAMFRPGVDSAARQGHTLSIALVCRPQLLRLGLERLLGEAGFDVASHEVPFTPPEPAAVGVLSERA